MARVSATAAGLGTLRGRIAAAPLLARAAAAAGVAEIATNAADLARADLAGGPGPSTAGTPPADPSGRLAAAIAATTDPGTCSAAVTVSAPEARFLEYGTARMAARPFLRPAAQAAARGARAILRAALRRELAP